MRFSAIHKLSSYLMAGTAFLALLLSGELGDLTFALGGLALLASWSWDPPRVNVDRWANAWTVFAIAAFGWTILSMVAGESLLIAGARFLVVLLVVKLFLRRTSKDYQHIYLISFLMLVAGTALNVHLSYAVCFLGYVIFATWALILFHLRREMEENFLLKHSDDSSSEKVEVERILNSRRIVGPAFLAGTSGVSLLIFVASAALFLVFPRIGFGLFFQKSRSGISMAGFTDGVTLGGHGLIRDDETVVMRVVVSDSRFRGTVAPELHWRGVAFDRYEDGRWSRSKNATATAHVQDIGAKRTTVYLNAGGRHDTKTLRAEAERAMRQEIYLEPLDTSTLFGASRPLAFEIENQIYGRRVLRGSIWQNDEIRFQHSSGLKYVVYSDPDPPPPAALRASPAADPELMAAYLQLPDELPPRVGELARRVTAGATTPYEKVVAVHAFLREKYSYTLEMDTDDDAEPLDYFLFERKKGHCEYFSSAMSILLREVGVPTRNVNGFLGGEWNEFGGYIAVRGGDAHSWVEVWFEGLGWVTWDPTPPGVDTPLGRGGGGFLDQIRRMLDTLRLKWFKWVIEYDLGRQMNLMKSIGSWLGFGPGGSRAGTKAASAWVRRHKVELALAIAGAAAAFGLIGWLRRRRAGAPGGHRRRASGPPHPVVALYLRLAAQLSRRGFPRPPATTPREHAHRLLATAAPGAAPFATLTELYYLARFSPDATVDLAQARTLAEEVRASWGRS